MRTTTLLRTLAALLAALLVAACGGEGSIDPDPSPAPTQDPVVEETTPPEDEVVEPIAAAEPIVVEVDFEERSHGTLVRVSRFEVTEQAVLVDVEIVAAAERAFVQFNNTQQNPAGILDDLGNTYPLVPIQGNGSLRFDGGEVLDGRLSFEGPVAEGAQTLQLVFNPNSEKDGPRTNDQFQPHFTFPPVDITGSGQTGSATEDPSAVATQVLDVDLTERSFDAVAHVSRVEVADVEIIFHVDITVAPEARGIVYFNNLIGDNKARVRDDRGKDYPIIGPDQGSSMGVEPGERLEGRLVFQGPLDRGVQSVQLVLNANSDPGTPGHWRYPPITFPPVDLTAG